jgi:tripartite ATP-independent transporter DctM subunit
MDPVLLASLGILALFFLIVLQVPIGIAMGAIGIIGFAFLSDFGPALSLISSETISALSNPDLAVVPIFLLMGNFATASGLSGDIYSLAYAIMGHRRGGLAMATIFGCGFFGAICGSSTATAATFGRVALPEMLKRKYSPSFATGCIAAGGTLGSLVPPSVILIIYAVMAEEFILKLFIAAIIPAIISIASYFIAISIYVRINPKAGPPGQRMGWPDRFRAVYRSWGAILTLLVVVGGIYGGVFTVNEAAAFGAIITLVFAFFRGRLAKKVFWNALTGTAITTAMIYVIIIGANTTTYFITLTHMPDTVVGSISNLQLPSGAVIFLLLVVYLVLGSIFDTIAAMLITLPFVLPLVESLGYNAVWWGIVNVVVIEIGLITPPIGLNVFVLQGVAREFPLNVIFRGIFPFLIADIFRLALIVVFPILILWLPSIMSF